MSVMSLLRNALILLKEVKEMENIYYEKFEHDVINEIGNILTKRYNQLKNNFSKETRKELDKLHTENDWYKILGFLPSDSISEIIINLSNNIEELEQYCDTYSIGEFLSNEISHYFEEEEEEENFIKILVSDRDYNDYFEILLFNYDYLTNNSQIKKKINKITCK